MEALYQQICFNICIDFPKNDRRGWAANDNAPSKPILFIYEDIKFVKWLVGDSNEMAYTAV